MSSYSPIDQPDASTTNVGEPIAEPTAQPTARKPAGSLLDIGDAEARRILDTITSDYDDAWQDNAQRIARFKRHYRAWRSKIGMAGGLSGRSNYRVPLIVEKVLIKWAKIMDALLGDDAEVVALPTGKVDRMQAAKVSDYMTWQVFSHMAITEELAKFIFQEIVFGRAHAELYYDIRWLYGPGDQRTLLYDGPCFRTLPMDCFIVPPSAGECTPQDFAWVCTREWKTLDQLLADESEGYYEAISDNAEAIWRHARDPKRYDETTDQLRRQQSDFEGVVTDYAATIPTTVEVRKHYFRWRMLKSKNRDAAYDDFKARELRERELCAYYIPDLNIEGSNRGLLIGVKDQAEIYPNTTNRRPIVSASLFKDGSYWPPSLPELLEDTEIEKSVNHNLMNEAGERAVSPPIFYIPGLGLSEEKHQLEPGMAYPTPDPSSVKVIDMRADYQFCVVRDQMLTAIAEGVSGLSAASVGRSPDTPNSPRTFRGQALLQGQSDIRQSLEMTFMSDDWSKILDQIKMLVDEYGPDEEEFRVTETLPSGYFNSKTSKITARERQGKYDFRLKFATSSQSREARKERALVFLQAAGSLPLFIQNPNLQRDWLKVMAKDLQMDGLLPALDAVPDTNVPMDPETEWVQALQGIAPQISIADDDQKHIDSHMGHLIAQQQLPQGEQDEDAQNKMIAHIMQHKEQQRQKMALQAAAQAAANAQAAAGLVGGLLGEQMGGPQQGPPGATPPGQGSPPALQGSPPMGAADMSAGFGGDMSPAEQVGGY